MTWLSSSASSNVSKAASTVAQRAAKQPPKAMRSASLSYVKQAIREKWKPMAALDKHVKDARKSVASRYLQLKSGHAVTGVHLLRIGKVQDARCWWCSSSRQTVEHVLLDTGEPLDAALSHYLHRRQHTSAAKHKGGGVG